MKTFPRINVCDHQKKGPANYLNCPSCGKDTLREEVRTQPVRTKSGDRIIVGDLYHNVCSSCGYTEVTSAQVVHNSNKIAASIITHENGMTPGKIRSMREKYGLTQAKAAAIFGGGPRAFSKYETGEVVPTESMERLLWLANQNSKVLEALATRAMIKLSLALNTPSINTRQVLLATIEKSRASGISTELDFKNISLDYMPKSTHNFSIQKDFFDDSIKSTQDDLRIKFIIKGKRNGSGN